MGRVVEALFLVSVAVFSTLSAMVVDMERAYLLVIQREYGSTGETLFLLALAASFIATVFLGKHVEETSVQPQSKVSCVVERRGFNVDGKVAWKIVCIAKKVKGMNFMYIEPENDPPQEEVVHAAVKAAEEAETTIDGVAVIGEENYEKYQAMVERELEKRGLLAK